MLKITLLFLKMGEQLEAAKSSYKTVLQHHQGHGKVLQQLGWLYQQSLPSSLVDYDVALSYLEEARRLGKMQDFLSIHAMGPQSLIFF